MDPMFWRCFGGVLDFQAAMRGEPMARLSGGHSLTVWHCAFRPNTAGAHDCVNFICDDPNIRAISFVGGDAAGKHIYERGGSNGTVLFPL
jgi:hypothetical protein